MQMELFREIAQSISILLFGGYGLSCLLSKKAIVDFEHYRLPRLRVLTGILQLAGAFGLLVGHFYRPLLVLSAGGLAAMMALAVLTRIRIRDRWYYALPSLTLCLLNVFLVVTALPART